MSKRPTFDQLIVKYGNARAYEGGAEMYADAAAIAAADLQTNAALEALRRALRKAGVPLDQVAP